MASGKFSNPRPHRDEERQIEEAFRQVTGQAATPRRVTRTENTNIEYTPRPQEPAAQEIPLEQAFGETAVLPAEPVTPESVPAEPVIPEPIPEEALPDSFFRQATVLQPPVAQTAATPPPQKKWERITLEAGRFFQEEIPEPQPEEPAEPDFIDRLLAFWDNKTGLREGKAKLLLVGICALSLVVILGFVGILLGSGKDPYNKKILDNVMAAGVNLGGMTRSEATSALKAASNAYTTQDMVIDFSGKQLRLTVKDVNPKLDVKSLVNKAYDYGRDGSNAQNALAFEQSRTQPHVIDITPYLSLNDRFIKVAIDTYAEEAGATLTQPSYGLEGEEPALTADKFSQSAPTQTLVITLGTPGTGFDPEAVYTQVMEAYYTGLFLVTVPHAEEEEEPEELDLDAIYKEFYIAPVEAAVDPVTQKTIPGSYGYEFDLEAARLLLASAQYGDELRIPMQYIAPTLLDDSSFFQDILGQHQTRSTGESSRNANLKLACDALKNTVIAPGATFSFNGTVGQRSAARGYKSAWSDTTAYATEYVGGGVSQVSSTLYAAAMTADLEILSRNTGSYAPSFVEMGLDAEVGTSLDLTFRNNTTYPIRIEAQLSGGSVKIQILGTEVRAYYVLLEQSVTQTIEPTLRYEDFTPDNTEGRKDGDVMEEGITGYSVKVYKVKYDSETNRQLSKDYVNTVNYRSEDRVIARVEVVETTAPTVPTTEATLPPSSETTAPPSSETTAPPSSETTAPPSSETTAPPSSETTAPPSSETTTPASSETTAPQESSEQSASQDQAA